MISKEEIRNTLNEAVGNKEAAISRIVLTEIKMQGTASGGIDSVFGKGTFDKLVRDLMEKVNEANTLDAMDEQS